MILERMAKAIVGNERMPQADTFARLLEGVLGKEYGYADTHWERQETDEMVRRIYLAHYNGIEDLRDDSLGDSLTGKSSTLSLELEKFPGLGSEREAEMRRIQDIVYDNFHYPRATTIDDYLHIIPEWFLAEITAIRR
jgi:hypothetical protein